MTSTDWKDAIETVATVVMCCILFKGWPRWGCSCKHDDDEDE